MINKENIQEPTVEQVQQFFEYLQGEFIPPSFNKSEDPELSLKHAWNVIYMLQEWLHIIPDHFELCSGCEQIFNIDDNGFYAGDDKEQIDQMTELGYDVSYDDIGKFFCSECRK